MTNQEKSFQILVVFSVRCTPVVFITYSKVFQLKTGIIHKDLIFVSKSGLDCGGTIVC